MPPLVIGLVLASAVLHASWNAMLRSTPDRLWSMAVMCAFCAVFALPVGLAFGLPAGPSWPFLLSSASLQIGYALVLVRSYRTGQLAHVYPIARGSAPLLVTLGAAVVAGEHLAPLSLLGVLLVSTGIVAIAFGHGRPDLGSTLAALATGAFIAAYMVVDGLGVRRSGNAIGYAAWQAVVEGAPMPIVYTLIRRAPPAIRLDRGLATAAGGALVSVTAYGVVIWAMSLGPMGKVSALRETSILFAAVIGVAVLKERVTARRLAGAAMIAGGAIALGFG
ncbi:EamA family transporter [Phenylobacterium soli]|uniref:EamA family transporter n=1 Tax=Phenylobacterium soli TaxID=2170551 RepID=A0A328AEW2_9CAUL|nr:EamA family transporter [Phenylobacterium soli]RAK53189.1 EamA family transporter [Phenylobacterium soli]